MDSIDGYGSEVTCFTSYHIHLHHRLPAGSDEYLGTRFIHSRPPAIVHPSVDRQRYQARGKLQSPIRIPRQATTFEHWQVGKGSPEFFSTFADFT